MATLIGAQLQRAFAQPALRKPSSTVTHDRGKESRKSHKSVFMPGVKTDAAGSRPHTAATAIGDLTFKIALGPARGPWGRATATSPLPQLDQATDPWSLAMPDDRGILLLTRLFVTSYSTLRVHREGQRGENRRWRRRASVARSGPGGEMDRDKNWRAMRPEGNDQRMA